MNKFIRKNQKKFLALFGVVLMISFAKGLVPDSGPVRSGPRNAGTLDGAKVTQQELTAAAQEWQLLKSLQYIDPNHPELAGRVRFLDRFPGREAATAIASNSQNSQPVFWLLVQQAKRQGIIVSPEELQTVVNNNIAGIPQPGTEEREHIEQAVFDCLMVDKLMKRAGNTVKATFPIQNWAMAQSAQMLSLNVVEIPATRYRPQVPPPTQDNIRKQFDAYRDLLPADSGETEYGDPKNPLGFGYKIPNRVTIQYIGLNRNDVHDAAVASRSDLDWKIAAFAEFTKNRQKYDEESISDLPPATAQLAGTTRPSAAPTPGPRTLDNVQDDFALHLPLVMDDLYNAETDKLQESILKQISTQLSAGFGLYRDARSSGASTAPSTSQGHFATEQYLAELGDKIESQYKVKPILGNIRQLKTENELKDLEWIGKAMTSTRIPFDQYATLLYQPWLSDAVKASPAAVLALSLWQPSNPLEDENQNVFIFRISGADPSHTPPLADIQERVIADWKLSTAYDKARDAALTLETSAAKIGLNAAATAADFSSPVATSLFNPEAILEQRSDPIITPLRLNPASARQLAVISRQLLTTPPGASGLPDLLAELYPDATIAVVELREARPLWTEQDKSFQQFKMGALYVRDQSGPLFADLCNYDDLKQRLNFQLDPTFKLDRQ